MQHNTLGMPIFSAGLIDPQDYTEKSSKQSVRNEAEETGEEMKDRDQIPTPPADPDAISAMDIEPEFSLFKRY